VAESRLSVTVWRDPGARAAAPDVAAIFRAEVPDEAGGEIRAVEDYALVFSSVQEPSHHPARSGMIRHDRTHRQGHRKALPMPYR
jgi:hypothetical protein